MSPLQKNLLISIITGIVVFIVLAELLRRYIFFSVLVGIPAGIVVAALLFTILMIITDRKNKKD